MSVVASVVTAVRDVTNSAQAQATDGQYQHNLLMTFDNQYFFIPP